MTVPTHPRRWGEILILAGFTLCLATTFVTGFGIVQCGPNSLCGYGTRCDNVTSQCVCLPGSGNLEKEEGNPNSVFYCLNLRTRSARASLALTRRAGQDGYRTKGPNKYVYGYHEMGYRFSTSEGVTQCGYLLCGYRAECNKARDRCECSFNYGKVTHIKDTSPSLWYCVETCTSYSRNCPENNTCTDRTGDNSYRCECSAGATLSSTGQCLGNVATIAVESTVHDTTQSASPTQLTTPEDGVTPKEGNTTSEGKDKEDDSQTLATGVAAGISTGVLLAVVIMVLLIRRQRRLKARDNGVLESMHSNANALSTEFNHSYENVVSLSLPGESRPESRAIATGDRPSVEDPADNSSNTYVNVSAPSQAPGNNDTSGLYESANTPDTSETRLYTTLG